MTALQHAEQVVKQLEEQYKRVQDAHERELGLMFEESVCLRSELEFKSTTLQLENKRLQDEVASYIVMQEQNVVLKEALSDLHERARDAEIRHKEEYEQLKESISEHKTKLHKEFKMRLQEVSG
jgi:hypothetical protein